MRAAIFAIIGLFVPIAVSAPSHAAVNFGAARPHRRHVVAADGCGCRGTAIVTVTW